MQLSDFRYPITANCLISLPNFNLTQKLVNNKVVNAPIKFEKIVMVMITFLTSSFVKKIGFTSS